MLKNDSFVLVFLGADADERNVDDTALTFFFDFDGSTGSWDWTFRQIFIMIVSHYLFILFYCDVNITNVFNFRTWLYFRVERRKSKLFICVLDKKRVKLTIIMVKNN